MFERILIPLDGSDVAEAVLPHLRGLLRKDATVLLLRVLPAFPPDFPFAAPGERAEADRYLRRIAAAFTDEGFVARTLLRTGNPAEAILRAAEEEEASRIALSSHGRSGLSALFLGSVAEKVLQASAIPVFVVRAAARAGLRPVRNILVPLDGSEASLQVLPEVLDLAWPADARVTLLHVEEPDGIELRWGRPEPAIDHACRALREACIPAETRLRTGEAAREILNAADEEAADVIALTTHGRSGPSKWAFGSVTAKVLRAASVPLLVVRRRRAAAVKLAELRRATP